MTTIPQLPIAPDAQPGDLVPLSQNGTLFAASVAQITAGLQDEIILPTGDVLGRASAGAGAPEALALGAGLAIGSTTLVATGSDHLAFPLTDSFFIADEVIVNSADQPARLPMAALRGLFVAGSGIAIDAGGTLSVTEGAIAGPVGPQGPPGPAGAVGTQGAPGSQGTGLEAPATTNTASKIAASDYVAIWQNGSNSWIGYQQLIGGQTINQLPAAGPANDSDLLLVAQGGNALASQSFAAIWVYTAQKIPTMRHGVVELTASTVLDATAHNQRILVISQPIMLSANFTNMGSGFSCRIINLSTGMVVMGTGIVSGSGGSSLPPGTSTELVGLTYSGGSLVWWDGVAPSTPTIAINAIGAPTPNTAFTVTGAFFDKTPAALDYSTDGTTWIGAVTPMIGAGSFSFQIPGLPAGTYTLSVRDHTAVSVVGISMAFSVVASSIGIGAVSGSVAAGGTISVSGSVEPAGSAIRVGLSSSATAPPAIFADATVNGGSWNAAITAPDVAGSAYVWAALATNATIQTISPPVIVTQATLGVAYTINQPAVTSVAAGAGSLALNGAISPAQDTATQVAFSTSTATPPATGWQAATIIDNNSIWAAYATVPAVAGTYYIWVEAATGDAASVSGFTVSVT